MSDAEAYEKAGAILDGAALNALLERMGLRKPRPEPAPNEPPDPA